jgi:restriction endonuclease S subunit
LVARVGANAGRINVVSGRYGVTDNTIILRLGDGASRAFIWRSLEAKRLNRMVFGSGQPLITGSQLKSIKISTPPLPEQHAIAEALSDVDALLGGLDRLIAKKRDLKQAAMQQLLTGQMRLPGFSGDWEPLNMAQKSLLKARIGWQGLTTAEYLATGTYYLVTGTDFSTGRVTWATCPFVAADRYEQDQNIQLRLKDVLVTKDGTIGKVAIVDELPGPATLNSGVFVIRPNGNAYQPMFLYFILASAVFEDFLRKLAAGSTISHLYQKDFVSFEFPAPPTVEEQAAIAALPGGRPCRPAPNARRRTASSPCSPTRRGPIASATATSASGTSGEQPLHRDRRCCAPTSTARLLGRPHLRALQKLETAADSTGITLYQANLRTYQLLRYGVPVQIAAGQAARDGAPDRLGATRRTTTSPGRGGDAAGGYERRPDIVLYLNGLAIAVIELKRSSVEVADGVRQLITNQEEIFNKGFFSTVQLVLAGSDSQGLRYGTTGTPEQFFVEWKDEAPPQPQGAAPAGRAARPAAGAVVQQGAAARPDPQLHHLRRRPEEGAAPHQFFGREGRAGAHRQARGRRHLAHPGQRQEHPDGADRQVAAGARPRGPHPRHHRPRRAGQADRGVMKNAGVIGESRRRRASPRGGVRREARGPRRACCAR